MRWVCGVTAVIAMSPSVARADPEQVDAPPFIEHGYGALGLAISGSDSAWTHGAFVLQGGASVPGSAGPFRARVRGFLALAGGTVQSDWSGNFRRGGAGAEVLTCTGILCGVLDLDVGYQSATLVEDNGRVHKRSGPLLGPRVGAEIGGERVRFRGMIEFYRWKTHHEPSYWMPAGGLSLELMIRF